MRECLEQEALALPILNRLPPEEREIVDRYIYLCESLEYQQARLAARHYAANGTREWSVEE